MATTVRDWCLCRLQSNPEAGSGSRSALPSLQPVGQHSHGQLPDWTAVQLSPQALHTLRQGPGGLGLFQFSAQCGARQLLRCRFRRRPRLPFDAADLYPRRVRIPVLAGFRWAARPHSYPAGEPAERINAQWFLGRRLVSNLLRSSSSTRTPQVRVLGRSCLRYMQRRAEVTAIASEREKGPADCSRPSVPRLSSGSEVVRDADRWSADVVVALGVKIS